jgi:hypothetical protein
MEGTLATDLHKWTRFDLRVCLKKELEIKVRKLDQYLAQNQKNMTSKNLYIHKKKLEISKLESILRYV